jgi:homogentisate 1,2-dioxygenase
MVRCCESNDHEVGYFLFSDKIREAMHKCCKIEGPHENRSRKKNNFKPRRLTKELQNMIKLRNKLYIRLLKNQSNENRHIYVSYRNFVNKQINIKIIRSLRR